MTVKDYISRKFLAYGIQLSEADLLDTCLDARTSGEDEMDAGCRARVAMAIARFIPELLLRPTSVTESDISMSWDTRGIKDYYALLCRQYGLENELGEKPKVTFL